MQVLHNTNRINVHCCTMKTSLDLFFPLSTLVVAGGFIMLQIFHHFLKGRGMFNFRQSDKFN